MASNRAGVRQLGPLWRSPRRHGPLSLRRFGEAGAKCVDEKQIEVMDMAALPDGDATNSSKPTLANYVPDERLRRVI